MDLLCSSSSPESFILLASCWAFFFNLHALDANLFFSFLDLVLERITFYDFFSVKKCKDVIWQMTIKSCQVKFVHLLNIYIQPSWHRVSFIRMSGHSSSVFTLSSWWEKVYLVGKGTSLTGVIEFISLPSFSSSRPILANLPGFAVRSLPSPRRALPLK